MELLILPELFGLEAHLVKITTAYSCSKGYIGLEQLVFLEEQQEYN